MKKNAAGKSSSKAHISLTYSKMFSLSHTHTQSIVQFLEQSFLKKIFSYIFADAYTHKHDLSYLQNESYFFDSFLYESTQKP